jgi:glutathione S-transferase
VHQGFTPLFGPASDSAKAAAIVKLGTKFSFIEKNLLGGPFLVGDKFSIADSYMYIVLGWGRYTGVDLSGHPKVQAYWASIDAMPQVVAAHALMAANPSST